MKLYYRKGLIRGLGITLLGVAFLLGDIFCFEEIEVNIIWSIIIIVGGIYDCLRCFSKKKAEEDIIADEDERNKFVKLVSKARSLDIVITVLFAIAFKSTGEMVFSGVILTSGFGIILIMLVKAITRLYYDKKE